MLVNQFLERSAERLPNKTALVCEGARLSYREIDAMANRVAHGLIGSGVQPGDRVVIFLDNGPEAVVAIFGALKASAVFSVVNPTTKTDKLRYMLQSLRPSALITHVNKLGVAAEACKGATALSHILLVGGDAHNLPNTGARIASWDTWMSLQPATRPPARSIDVDLASIVFTSGSTGNPKGVMCEHRNMVSVAGAIASYLENVESDVVLNVLQLAASYGLYQVLVAFMVGATVVMERSFAFPYQVIALMQREGVTGFAAVPTIYSMLLSLKDLAKHPIPTLRYLTNAGAGLPERRALQLHAAFPESKLYLMYGQTECVRVCYLAPEEVARRPGSVGKAIPNTEIFIVDELDQAVGPGVVGELVVRGSHVMRGYWEEPEKTAARFRSARRHDGQGIGLPGETLLFTNDLFRMDEEGYLYFESRTDDIIKSRGEKVAPREVEHVLYNFEGVRDAVAVGVPDDVLGEAIKVCVVPHDGITLDPRALREYCRRNLEDFMMPKYVEIWPELPKGATGKVDRKAIAAGLVPELT